MYSDGGLHHDNAERSSSLLDFFPSQSLPPAPASLFARDAVIDDLLGLMERFTSIVLFGAGGIGKSATALTLLHHDQVTARFGEHRYFMRCDNLANSLDSFLGRLSEITGPLRTTDMTQIRSRLTLSPHILVLDGVDHILDPLAPGAAEIAAAIEEFSRCQNVCLVTTSKMDVGIPDFRHIEVPMLPEDGARHMFHSRCHLIRSPGVDKLLGELDFHPLSVDLLATAVRENGWDEPTLLNAWDGGNTSILKVPGRQSLEDNIESILLAPSLRKLGSTARKTLEGIALFPRGVRESSLESMFPRIAGVREAADVLCKFSLVYRRDGLVKTLSPFRLYFLESIQSLADIPGRDPHNPDVDEDIQYISGSSSIPSTL